MNQYPNGPQQPNQQSSNPGYPQQPGYPPGYMPGYPPMQPPQPQQTAPKKKVSKMGIGCGVVAFVVVLAVLIGIANGGSTTTTSSGGNSTTSQAPSKPQTWQTTHTYTGNGAKKTETITVGGDWKIQWSCTPSSFMGNSYNVIISVYNSDGTPADYAAVNTMCKDGNTSGETEERTAGNIYLDVNSEGQWTISVLELK